MFHVERKQLYDPSPLSPPEGGEGIRNKLTTPCVFYKNKTLSDWPN